MKYSVFFLYSTVTSLPWQLSHGWGKNRFLIFLVVLGIAFQGCELSKVADQQELTRYVDPFIGTDGEGNVSTLR